MGDHHGKRPRYHRRDPGKVGQLNRWGVPRPSALVLAATTFGGVTAGLAILYLTALMVAT